MGSFSSQVLFSCVGAPAAVSCSSPPIQLTAGGSGQATFKISTDPTIAAGTYNLTLSAVSLDGQRTKQQSLSMEVLAQADFTLGNPVFASPTAEVGQTLSSTITLSYNGTVTLSCTGSGAGIPTSACLFSPNNVALSSSPVTVTLAVPTGSASAASGQITVQATDGTSTHIANLPFSIIDYSVGGITGPSATPPGSTASFNFTLTPLNGYNQSVTLSCDTRSLGQSVPCAFTPASPVALSPGSTTVVNASFVVPSATTSGSYSVGLKTQDSTYSALVHNQTTAT